MHGPIVPSLVFYIEKGDGRTDRSSSHNRITRIYTHTTRQQQQRVDLSLWYVMLLPGFLLLYFCPACCCWILLEYIGLYDRSFAHWLPSSMTAGGKRAGSRITGSRDRIHFLSNEDLRGILLLLVWCNSFPISFWHWLLLERGTKIYTELFVWLFYILTFCYRRKYNI